MVQELAYDMLKHNVYRYDFYYDLLELLISDNLPPWYNHRRCVSNLRRCFPATAAEVHGQRAAGAVGARPAPGLVEGSLRAAAVSDDAGARGGGAVGARWGRWGPGGWAVVMG